MREFVRRSLRAARAFLLSLPGLALGPALLAGQGVEGPLVHVESLRGTLERVTVHGDTLEGNLAGDSPDRPVSVYLPPGYENDPDRRYPVVYVLHGFTDSDVYWFGWREHFVNVPAAMERALDEGTTRGMILVMPNAHTAFQGSMYSSSETTGDWETFVAEDLVGWVDAHYRTLPDRGSRGLAGHSMGGYDAIRVAMKRPEVFSSVYVMSPCCLAPDLDPEVDGRAALEDIRSFEDLRRASFGPGRSWPRRPRGRERPQPGPHAPDPAPRPGRGHRRERVPDRDHRQENLDGRGSPGRHLPDTLAGPGSDRTRRGAGSGLPRRTVNRRVTARTRFQTATRARIQESPRIG